MVSKIISYAKEHPKTTALAIFGIGAVLVFSRSGSSDSAGGVITVQGGNDSATTLQLAAIQAQADTEATKAAAAVQVANAEAAAAATINEQNAQAAIQIAQVNADVQNRQTAAAVKVATTEQVGINGIIHTTPANAVEAATRNLGYAGAFGAGGADAFLKSMMSASERCAFYKKYGVNNAAGC